MSKLKGLVAFITGGSSGLGKATLQHLLNLGGKVYSYDIQNYLGTIDKDQQQNTLFMQADIRDEKKLKSAIQECRSKFGKIDALINCAGVGISFFIYNPIKGRVHSARDYKDVFDINVTGTYNVIRHGVGYLAEKNFSKDDPDDICGTVITVSGIPAYNGVSGQSCYAGSCGAIESMVAPMAKEFALKRIRCINIQVGYFDTPVFERAQDEIKDFLGNYCTFPRRLGKPEEFAKLVETILTNKFLNATTISISGDNRLHIFTEVFSKENKEMHRKLPYDTHIIDK